MNLNEIPSIDYEPVIPPIGRRALLQFATSAVVGLGVWSLGLFGNKANAAIYDNWGNCQGYFEGGSICTPSSWCNPGAVDSGGYWHKHGYWEYFGPSTYVYWNQDPDECNGKNAWWWAANYRSPTNKFCSDGENQTSTPWGSWWSHDLAPSDH